MLKSKVTVNFSTHADACCSVVCVLFHTIQASAVYAAVCIGAHKVILRSKCHSLIHTACQWQHFLAS